MRSRALLVKDRDGLAGAWRSYRVGLVKPGMVVFAADGRRFGFVSGSYQCCIGIAIEHSSETVYLTTGALLRIEHTVGLRCTRNDVGRYYCPVHSCIGIDQPAD